jgi:hypothetical protein
MLPQDILHARTSSAQEEGGTPVDYVATLVELELANPEPMTLPDGKSPSAALLRLASDVAKQKRDASDGRFGAVIKEMVLRHCSNNTDSAIDANNEGILANRLQVLRAAGVTPTPSDLDEIGSIDNAVRIERNSVILLAEAAQFCDQSQLPGLRTDSVVSSIIHSGNDWTRRVGSPRAPGLAGRSSYGFKPKVYEEVLAAFNGPSTETRDENTDIASAARAYNLTCLFGSKDRIDRYVEKWDAPPSEMERDPGEEYSRVAATCVMPWAPGWPIPQWGDAILRHGPHMMRFVRYAEPKEAPPPTVAAAKERYPQGLFPGSAECPKLAALCDDLVLDNNAFLAAKEAWLKIDPTTAGANIPDISVKGDRFGLPGYVWRTANPKDPRVLLAGKIVNCCQHTTGHAAEAAIHSAQSPNGRCFFLEKEAKGSGAPSLVAVSWAWRGGDGDLCLDSYESKGEPYRSRLPQIMAATVKEVEVNHPEIKRITLGKGGKTPSMELPSAETPAKPVDFTGSREDSLAQYLVFCRDKATDMRIAQEAKREIEIDGSSWGRYCLR